MKKKNEGGGPRPMPYQSDIDDLVRAVKLARKRDEQQVRKEASLSGGGRRGRPNGDKWPVIAKQMVIGKRVVVRDYQSAVKLENELRLRGYRGEKKKVVVTGAGAGVDSAYIVMNAGATPKLFSMCRECREAQCWRCTSGLKLDPRRSAVACDCVHDEIVHFVGFLRGRPGFGKMLTTTRKQ